MARAKAKQAARGGKTLNASDQHRSWLELVDMDGPFLAIPPLKRVWPQGMPTLDEDRKAALVYARKDFEGAWERLDRSPDDEDEIESYRLARDKWVETILRDVAGWAESLSWGEVPGVEAKSLKVTVHAQAALNGTDGVGALVHVVDAVESLRQTPGDGWAANPIDRVETMLRESGVPVGIVTDGRWWGLVCARAGTMAASGIVDALTWIEESRTRDAFFALIGRQHLIGGDPSERLPVLFEESVAAAEEITEALGAQVRRAVELLVQSFSESAADAQRRGLPNPLPDRTHDTYEAAVTVMMRTVFLLFAEERGLLPSGELFEQGYGIVGELDRLKDRASQESEEALDATALTWHRLLATSQALYQGATFENLRMPAYGGSLFRADRFPFLTATNEQGTLAVSVSDRVMLHVLRSVQIADIKGEARHISFRDIDVEQIGYIYEGLLGYTAAVATEVTVGLKGTLGEEPEIPLAKLEALADEHSDPKKLATAIREFIKVDQPSAKPSTVAAIAKAVKTDGDAGLVSALTQAVGDDLELRDRVKPWLGVIRVDLRNRPFVILDGGLIVKETPSRKNAGAHYTPKSLAEEVVLHALQPLCYSPGPYQTADEAEWKLKTSGELLSLKVADIACGSGAFLVAAARYLADRVVEAWLAEDTFNGDRIRNQAIREVVARCLYGADINDMAVEMCKLSLWLVSLDRDLPFSFVDDKIFLGNSLLGLTDRRQLRNLHIDPGKTSKYMFSDHFDIDIDGILSEVASLRHQLASPVNNEEPARSALAKSRELERALGLTRQLRKMADGVVAAGLKLGGKPGSMLDDKYKALRDAAKSDTRGDTHALDKLISDGLTPTVVTDYERWQPLHWFVEAPDVMVDNGGFDAIIGNPPFLGGQKLTGAMGTNVRDWFINTLADGRRGSADLVAYFFLRATALLQAKGTLGLIATNTVAQGDTREVGLDAMTAAGFTITRAIQSRSWPASSANLEYAAVWGTSAAVADEVPRIADDIQVRRISTLLEPAGQVDDSPLRLHENAGVAFQGCIVLGMGFVITEDDAQEWIAADPRNADVVFPYLNGEDLNGRPDCSASRWVIDFNDLPESEARTFNLPYGRVYSKVKPDRQRLHSNGSFVLRKPLPQRWWQYGEKRPAMRRAIAGLSEVLVIALVSKTVMPVRVQTGQVFSHKLGIFSCASNFDLAVLSSSLHQTWAVKYGSTMRTDVNYSPSDVFETFPRPTYTLDLSLLGERLHEDRKEIMTRRGLGLTKLYNHVNNPDHDVTDVDIARLREMHVAIDHAAIAAYGWNDIELGHGFHTYRRMKRWTICAGARVEVLDRLLSLNSLKGSATSDNRSSGTEILAEQNLFCIE